MRMGVPHNNEWLLKAQRGKRSSPEEMHSYPRFTDKGTVAERATAGPLLPKRPVTFTHPSFYPREAPGTLGP